MKVLTNLARKPVIGFFTAIVALSLATCLQAQTTAAKTKVQSVKGTAFYTPPGGKRTVLKPNVMLAPGTKIETEAKASVDIFMGAMAGMVRVAEKSTLIVEQYNVTKTAVDQVIDVQLNLPEGTIYGTVNKLSAASKYHIKTPDGVAGVRGTKYTITVKRDANGKVTSYCLVSDGTVIIIKPTAANANAQNAPDGSSVVSQDGQTIFTVTAGAVVNEDGTLTTMTAAQATEAMNQIQPLSEVTQTLTDLAGPGGLPTTTGDQGQGGDQGQQGQGDQGTPEIPITR